MDALLPNVLSKSTFYAFKLRFSNVYNIHLVVNFVFHMQEVNPACLVWDTVKFIFTPVHCSIFQKPKIASCHSLLRDKSAPEMGRLMP